MKKFLTVLLVIAVIFTFSVGSAFAAVDYSWASDSNETGLASAKAEVIAKIQATDLSGLSAVGQLIAQQFETTYIKSVKDAASVNDAGVAAVAVPNEEDLATYYLAEGTAYKTAKYTTYNAGAAYKTIATKGVYTLYNDFLAEVANLKTTYAATTTLATAVTNAKKQLDDYEKLISDTGVAATVWTTSAVKSTGYANMAAVITAAKAQVDLAKTVAEVDAAVDKYLAVINGVIVSYSKAAVTAADKAATVQKIRQEAAALNVVTPAYTAEKVVEFAALVEAAVAEANAATSVAELKAVENKYLGVADSVVVENNTITIVRYVKGAFAKLVGETVASTDLAQTAALALEALGAYDYTAVRYTATLLANVPTEYEATFWYNVEMANDYLEKVKAGKATATSTVYGTLATAVKGVLAGTLTTSDQKKTAVKNIVTAYAEYTKLGKAKADALALFDTESTADNYFGKTVKNALVTKAEFEAEAGAYTDANEVVVKAYWTQATAAIKAATTVAEVESFVSQYKALIDAVNTVAETNYAKAVPLFNAYLEAKFADLERVAATTYTATDKALVAALVADLEAKFAAYKFVAYQGAAAFDYTVDGILSFPIATKAEQYALSASVPGVAGASANAAITTQQGEDGPASAYYTYTAESTGEETYTVYRAPLTIDDLLVYSTGKIDGLVDITDAIAELLGYDTLVVPATNAFTNGGVAVSNPVYSTTMTSAEYSMMLEQYTNYATWNSMQTNWNVNSWYDVFGFNGSTSPYNAYKAQFAAMRTFKQLQFLIKVEQYNTALAALKKVSATPIATASYTSAFGVLATAKSAVDTAYNALTASEKAGVAKFDATEYNALLLAYYKVYYDKKVAADTNRVASATTTAQTAWATIKTAFDTAGAAYDVLSTADKAAAVLAVAKGDAAIAVAAKADKEAAAEAAIASLAQFKYYVAADDLATVKANAVKYFNKWETKVFTPTATTKMALAKEIAAFAGGAVADLASVKVTTKKVAKGIEVTVDAVPGATKYNFYRATSLNGTYKLMLSKATNVYTNTAVTKGVKYYYKATVVVNGVESGLTTHTGVRTW